MKRTRKSQTLPPVCWVSRPKELAANISEGFNLCPTCADKQVEKFRAQFPANAEEIRVGGNYYDHETDGPATCSECGTPLASYVLGAEKSVATLKQWEKCP